MIAIACDHGGYDLKKALCDWMDSRGMPYENLGTDSGDSVDYPEYAHRLAAGIADGTYEKGILVCGTGLGMSMAANRHPGVRAALCSESFSAAMSRRHNDANVLCIGGRVTGPEVAFEILEIFLGTPFDGDRHARRISKIEID
ncbi:MAG: ribose 5-phosphate isomerase B [Deltaproteobacteria bacterium]|nr:ribose 5-phosphate isomerase B [Deltaproteobacteria bacterium]